MTGSGTEVHEDLQ